jgi:hypothetical protein
MRSRSSDLDRCDSWAISANTSSKSCNRSLVLASLAAGESSSSRLVASSCLAVAVASCSFPPRGTEARNRVRNASDWLRCSVVTTR